MSLDAVAAGRFRAHSVVDPEALVILSLLMKEDERRLEDILSNWAANNSTLLSVQRTKNLAADYAGKANTQLSWFAGLAVALGKDSRWRSLAGHSVTERETPFSSKQVNRQWKTRAKLADQAALLLRLRLGFGVGIKADLLGFLLTTSNAWTSVREACAATGYTVSAVRRAAEDMAAARLIHVSTELPVTYRARWEAWNEVLGFPGALPPWRYWHPRFAFASAFLEWARAAAERPLTPYSVSVKLRELMERHRRAFAGVRAWEEEAEPLSELTFVNRVISGLAEWMEASV
jgi:hypothetical protein